MRTVIAADVVARRRGIGEVLGRAGDDGRVRRGSVLLRGWKEVIGEGWELARRTEPLG